MNCRESEDKDMKLYFYLLSDNGIVTTVHEAVEKSKTYYPATGNVFPGYIGVVRKENIGKITGFNLNMVIFTEPNFEAAKELLKKATDRKIRIAKEKAEILEEVLRKIEESEETIDE